MRVARLLTHVAVACLLAGPDIARAAVQPPGEECKGSALEASRQHNRKAAKFAKDGRLAEAYDELTFAFKLCPDPKVLLNMAKLCTAMERYQEALDAYRDFIDKGADAETRPKVEQLLRELESKLAKTRGRLIVQTDPPEAFLVVDGDEARAFATPADRWLTPGAHRIVVKAPGFESVEQLVNIEVGQPEKREIRLAAVFLGGTLTVDSSQAGARVLVDGDFLGLAPLREYRLAAGEHQLRVEKEGFQPFEQSFTLERQGRHAVAVRLAPTGATTGSAVATTPEPGGQPALRAEPRGAASQMSTWGWVCIGTGAGLAVGGLGANVWAFMRAQDASELDTNRSQADINRDYNTIRDDFDTGMKAAYGLYAVGGAALVAGILLVVLDPGDEPPATEPASPSARVLPTLAPGGAGLVLIF